MAMVSCGVERSLTHSTEDYSTLNETACNHDCCASAVNVLDVVVETRSKGEYAIEFLQCGLSYRRRCMQHSHNLSCPSLKRLAKPVMKRK